jgi:hypothetical protein
MGPGRPIVLGVEGETRDIIERAGCDIPIEPESPQELTAAVRHLAERPEVAREMGAKAWRAPCASTTAGSWPRALRTCSPSWSGRRSPGPSRT